MFVYSDCTTILGLFLHPPTFSSFYVFYSTLSNSVHNYSFETYTFDEISVVGIKILEVVHDVYFHVMFFYCFEQFGMGKRLNIVGFKCKYQTLYIKIIVYVEFCSCPFGLAQLIRLNESLTFQGEEKEKKRSHDKIHSKTNPQTNDSFPMTAMCSARIRTECRVTNTNCGCV